MSAPSRPGGEALAYFDAKYSGRSASRDEDNFIHIVAIGRTEFLRAGLRQEIILDPNTGLVIGEPQIRTFAAFGFGINAVLTLTAVHTSVTETAPTQ